MRLSNIEPRFVCGVCDRYGAEVRPNFHWNVERFGGMVARFAGS